MTNVAAAIIREPRLPQLLRGIVLMGGIARVGGSLDNPWAEYNVRVDPEASALVFGLGVPITMVGLDVTKRVKVRRVGLGPLFAAETTLGRVVANQLARHIGCRSECRAGGRGRLARPGPRHLPTQPPGNHSTGYLGGRQAEHRHQPNQPRLHVLVRRRASPRAEHRLAGYQGRGRLHSQALSTASGHHRRGGAEWERLGEPDTDPGIIEDGWTVHWQEYGKGNHQK